MSLNIYTLFWDKVFKYDNILVVIYIETMGWVLLNFDLWKDNNTCVCNLYYGTIGHFCYHAQRNLALAFVFFIMWKCSLHKILACKTSKFVFNQKQHFVLCRQLLPISWDFMIYIITFITSFTHIKSYHTFRLLLIPN